MEEEANQARTENTELYAELSRREGVATELIASQQTSYETLQRAIIEHEVMITAAEMYEKHIAEMQEALIHEERCVPNMIFKNNFELWFWSISFHV